MARPKSVNPPSYCWHRSGNARVVIDGKEYSLGKYGSPESRERYDRLIAEWLERGRTAPQTQQTDTAPVSVNELLLGFHDHIDKEYGAKASHWYSFRDVMRIMKNLYGTTPAGQFGPLALKCCREQMVKEGWCRNYVNRQVQRLCRIFKWGVEQEMLLPTVWHGLKAVPGLRAGKTEALETEPVKPLSQADIDEILPHLPPMVRDMVLLQLATGMRPGEVCILRPANGNELRTSIQMAFWLKPGEKSFGNPASNDQILSNHLLSKKVRIGYKSLPHAIQYEVTFTIPKGEHRTFAQLEALTGCIPEKFSKFWKFDPMTGKLPPLDDGPGEEEFPIVSSTPDVQCARGCYSPDQPLRGFENAGYGRFCFRAEKVVKWNCIFRLRDAKCIASGAYRFRNFVGVGTLEDVRKTMRELAQEFGN